MAKKTTTERHQPETKNSKKPYASPRLVEYGDVAKLTASGGSATPHDSMTLMAA
jgi:hypothetical protein